MNLAAGKEFSPPFWLMRRSAFADGANMKMEEVSREITETWTYSEAGKDDDNKAEYRLAALPLAVSPKTLNPGDELAVHFTQTRASPKDKKARSITCEDEQRCLNKKKQKAAQVIMSHEDGDDTP